MGNQSGLVMSAANTMGLFGGKMVIDPAVPATQLTARGVIDAGAATDAIVFPSGTTAQRPGAPVNGMIRYNSSTSKFEGYQGGLWTDIITSGAAASAPDRGIQFNSGGAFTASSNFQYMADGDLLLSGTHTGTASVPATGAGTRMFFDTQKSAFRAGYVNGTQWDNASIGDYSAAMGYSATASGAFSTAMGFNTTASGAVSTVMGNNVVAGNGTAGNGLGDGSMALGLIDDIVTITTRSQVTGIQSLGIFMGDQDGLVMTGANTMALFGGKMVIDSAVPATYMAAPTYNLSFSGDTAAQTIGVERETTAATAGRDLSINAGGAVLAGTDLAGGNLVLKSGIATGNGLSSIQFQTVMPGQGAGAADRAPATSMTLASNALSLPAGPTAQRPGSAGMQAAVNGMIRYNSSNGKFEGYQAGAWTNLIGGGAIDDLSDAKTDYATDFNLFMGTAADAWTPAVGSQYNLAIGQNALDAALTNAADYNMAIGYNALTANTSGSRNIAIGPFALDTVTTGAGNVAIGPTAMQDTPAGTMRNVAIGDSAGYKSDGDDNVFIGSAVRSASGGTIGSQNVAIGSDAMRYANGSGNVILGYDAGGTGNAGMSVDDMVAIGRLSLGSATDGDKNVGVGIYTLSDTTTGYNNVAIGSYALEKNVAKQESTAIGYGAMEYADSAAAGSVTYNTAIGAYALQGSATPASNTGTSNTAIGHSALLGVTSGSGNIAIGDRAADTLTTGSNNITIGSNIDVVSVTGSSQLNIGDTIYGDMANDLIRIGGAGAVSAFSDLELAGTLALKVSSGTTAQRPGTGANGMLRYNTTTGKFEGYQGGSWQDIVTGAAVSTFLSLTDTPASYAGAGGQFVKVNAGANALEFTDTLVNSFSGQPAPTGMVFDDLDDVVITAVASGQFPVYNGTNWVNASNLSWNGTTLAVTGNITFTGTLHDVSDMRLKKDIVPLHDRGSIMDKLEQIGTYSFRMKDDKEGQIEFGVMAQEINKVFPELVVVDESTAEKYMSVNYLGLIAPLLEASKELKAENDDLKTRLASVEDDIKGMKAYTGYGINKASVGPGMMIGMIIGMIAATGFSALFFAVFALRRQRRQMAGQPTSIE